MTVTGWEKRRTGEIVQLVTSAKIGELEELADIGIEARTIHNLITEFETMGLFET